MEFFVALTDSAVPWVMGRIVTLVTRVPPDLFLAETWPWLLGMALVVLVARPTTALVRYLITKQITRLVGSEGGTGNRGRFRCAVRQLSCGNHRIARNGSGGRRGWKLASRLAVN